MSSTRLPVLLLPHPFILLPTARLTFPISRALAEAILALLDDSDTAQPLLAAIPVPAPSEAASPDAAFDVSSAINSLPTYGTAARVVRLVRPRSSSSPGASRQPYLLSLHGLTRIRLTSPLQMDTTSLDTLPLCKVLYPSAEGTPSRVCVDAFKDAALSLLDRLAKDSVQPQRKDDWLRVAAIVEDISEQRAALMADVLVAAVSGQFGDKLSMCITSPFLIRVHSSPLAFLAATDVEDRLHRATELFVKQSSIQEVSKKIATAVDESLSRQQKEYFLRQQLAAIQRELHSLHNSPGTAGPGFGTGGATNELDDDDQADADDLADLRRKIEALDVGTEERKVGVREWRRLKRIPQGSVENGVIRSYVSPFGFSRASTHHRTVGVAHECPLAVGFNSIKHIYSCFEGPQLPH